MYSNKSKTQSQQVSATRYIFRGLLMGLVLCILVGILCFASGRMSVSSGNDNAELDAVVLQEQLAGIRELATVQYHYTNMGQYEDSKDIKGWTIPFTTSTFVLTYDGVIKAGVDLSKTEVSVKDKEVIIRLPAAAILSHEIIQDSEQVFDEQSSILNPLNVEDFTAFQNEQKTVMEEKALEGGLLTEASSKAEEEVRAMLDTILPEDYTLTFQSLETVEG